MTQSTPSNITETGYEFGFDDMTVGECVGQVPVVVFIRDRLPWDQYPQTEEEYDRLGFEKVEQGIVVSCDDYQRFAALGAPLLACANCPTSSKS